MTVVIDFPAFDTGQYSGHEFNMADGSGHLRIFINELGVLTIKFNKLRYHRFVAMPNCTAEQVKAYFRVVDMGESRELLDFMRGDRSSIKSYSSLKHFMVYLDESGCHEVICEGIHYSEDLESAQQDDAPEPGASADPASQRPLPRPGDR